jgi:serine/threonine-protein kinase/endoribonuclease IRE1
MSSRYPILLLCLLLSVILVVVGAQEVGGRAREEANGEVHGQAVDGQAGDRKAGTRSGEHVLGQDALRAVLDRMDVQVNIDDRELEELAELAELEPGGLEISFGDSDVEDELLKSPSLLQALTDKDLSLSIPVNISSMMLVSLADGTIVALDENTGERLWSVDTGSPLVMSSKEASSREGIFPSTDGSLFTYKMNDDGSAGSVEKLPLKVKDLVDSSPSPTPEGNVVLGSQQTVVFIIDLELGLVTKKISGDEKDLFSYLQGSAEKRKQQTCDVGKEFQDAEGGEKGIGGGIKNGKRENERRRKEIAISRKTYVARSIHPSLGEQWNVTWSKLDKLGGGHGSVGPTFVEIYGHGNDQNVERDDLKLVLAPDFSLRRIHPETGQEMWSASFKVPPTVAYPAMGKAIDLLETTKKLLAMAAEVGSMVSATGDEANDTSLVKGPRQKLVVSETLVVGEIGGNVFGLLAPYFKTEIEDDPDDEARVPQEHRSDDVGEQKQSTALISVPGVDSSAQVGHAGKPCKDGNGMCRIPVGFYPLVGNSTDTRLLYLPKCENDELLDECDALSDDVRGIEGEIRQQTAYTYLVVVSASTAITVFVSVAYFARQLRRKGANQLHQHAVELPNGNTRVGRLEITKSVLGYGSGGTVVFDGILDSRKVAVKRMLKQLVDLAQQEIKMLIDSDEHPNIVRCFALEEDGEFLYLALERCDMSLNDAMEALRYQKDKEIVEAGGDGQPVELDEHRVARDIAEGVNAVHTRGIVHRDLKPHNVLLNASGRAKLSDMGLSKKLVDNQASFETLGAGGSPGWQAPEQLIARTGGNARLTASVDIFSSGMLIYYCLTRGDHPYGESFDRDGAIMKDTKNLEPIEGLPCALNLITAMLSKNAENRPTSEEVLEHPMWWSAHQRLAFLTDFSDRIEVLNRAKHASQYHELESLGPWAIGEDGEWWSRLDPSSQRIFSRSASTIRGPFATCCGCFETRTSTTESFPETCKILWVACPISFWTTSRAATRTCSWRASCLRQIASRTRACLTSTSTGRSQRDSSGFAPRP